MTNYDLLASYIALPKRCLWLHPFSTESDTSSRADDRFLYRNGEIGVSSAFVRLVSASQ